MDFLEDMSKIIIPLVLIAGAAYVAVSSAKNHDEKHEKDDDNYMSENSQLKSLYESKRFVQRFFYLENVSIFIKR